MLSGLSITRVKDSSYDKESPRLDIIAQWDILIKSNSLSSTFNYYFELNFRIKYKINTKQKVNTKKALGSQDTIFEIESHVLTVIFLICIGLGTSLA
jgi:hypothetical protein